MSLLTHLNVQTVMRSDTLRRVILLELTVPTEANVRAGNARKKSRYGELASEIRRTTNQEGAGWKVEVLPVEVTARSFLPGSPKSPGLAPKEALKEQYVQNGAEGIICHMDESRKYELAGEVK